VMHTALPWTCQEVEARIKGLPPMSLFYIKAKPGVQSNK
jgi:hypothetical protein